MAIGRFLGGVGALIWDPPRNKYLLLRRAPTKDFSAGVWECVTGRVDQGEGFIAALHREVQEEIGVRATIAYFLGTTHFYRGAPSPENELIGVVFACTVADPAAVQISGEHDDWQWVTPAQANDLLTATDASTRWTRRIIAQAERIRHQLSASTPTTFEQIDYDLG